MSFSARLLVIADTPGVAGALSARLETLGFSTATAAGDGAACAAAGRRTFDAAVIHAPERALSEVTALASRLKAAAAPRLLAVIAVVAPNADTGPEVGGPIDALLREPAHVTQVAARAQLVVRLAVMEDEVRLRARTMAAHGPHVDLALDREVFETPRVLFVGDPHRQFLALHRALASAGAHVTASFTSFTAFDYLHEQDFDAVVANAIETNEPAFTVCAALRRNTRLHHLPALLFIDVESFRDGDEAFARGVSDLLGHTAETSEMAARVMSLARERRRREQVKAAFAHARAPFAIEPKSGLATPHFFVDHLDAMANRARATDRPLSALVAQATAPRTVEPAARDAALAQMATMLRHLVRAEDLASSLEPGVFAVAMPGANLKAASIAAQRIEAIAECTAFDGGAFGNSFQLQVKSTTAQLTGEERGRGFLARAVRGLDRRAYAS